MKKYKKGFCIIESLTYIFMTMIILSTGLSLAVSMYKSYLENAEVTKEYNDIQNFYLYFQNIISERNTGELNCSDKEIKFSKFIEGEVKNKAIVYKPKDKAIVVKTYNERGAFLNENKMLGNVSNMSVMKKGNLIYLVIYDRDGKEFISCI